MEPGKFSFSFNSGSIDFEVRWIGSLEALEAHDEHCTFACNRCALDVDKVQRKRQI
jgi:hypothetical protein